MNKNINTLLFILLGTLANILIMLFLLVILLILATWLVRNIESNGVKTLTFLLCIIGSIVGTFLIYSRIVRWINKKWKLDNYIKPLFPMRRN